jgi:hypothetical protein
MSPGPRMSTLLQEHYEELYILKAQMVFKENRRNLLLFCFIEALSLVISLGHFGAWGCSKMERPWSVLT